MTDAGNMGWFAAQEHTPAGMVDSAATLVCQDATVEGTHHGTRNMPQMRSATFMGCVAHPPIMSSQPDDSMQLVMDEPWQAW